MAKQMLNVPSFGGGLNTALDPRDIKPNEVSDSRNVAFDVNGIIKPAGRCDDSLGLLKKIPYNDFYFEDIRGGMNLYHFESSFRKGEAVDGQNNSTNFSDSNDVSKSERFSHKIFDDDGAPLEETTIGNYWYLFATDSSTIGDPGVHAYTYPEDSYLWDEHVITPYYDISEGRKLHAVFHYNSNAVRVNNSFETYKNRCKWFGFIRQRNFFENSADTKDYHFNGWYELDNDIKKPTLLEFTTEGDTPDGPATGGTGFEIFVRADSLGTMDFSEDLTGTALIYDFAATFIYDGIQESLPFILENKTVLDIDGNAVTDESSLEITVKAKTGYNPRITGGRIYYRKANSNDDYVLLCDIDFEKGLRASLDDVYVTSSPWTSGSGNQLVVMSSNIVDLTTKNIDTYSSLTEWGIDETRISIGCTGSSDDDSGNYPQSNGETYEASAITNGRCFIANTRLYKTEGTNARPPASSDYVMEPNRIYYSGTCSSNGVVFQPAYDCFPRRNFIDIETENASGFTALFGFADRLFAFKRDILYILNVSGTTTEWFVESEHEGLGIELSSQFSQFDEGAVWANKTGVYVYTGGDINNKTSEDISFGIDIKNIWAKKLAKSVNALPRPMVGYSRFAKTIVVHSDYSDSNGDTFLYNFSEDNWSKCNRIFKASSSESSRGVSNLIINHVDRLIFAKEMDGDADVGGSDSPTSLIVNHNFPLGLSDTEHGYDNGDGTVVGWPTSGSNTSGISVSVWGDMPSHNVLMMTLDSIGDDYIDAGYRHLVHYGPISLTNGNVIVCYGTVQSSITNPDGRFVDFSFVTDTAGGPETEFAKEVISEGSNGIGTTDFYHYRSLFTGATGDYFFRIGTAWSLGPNEQIGAWTLIDFGHENTPGLAHLDITNADSSIRFFGIDVNNMILGNYENIEFKSGSQYIVTKDFDFGQPGLKKRIYNLFCTYSTDSTHSSPVSYALDGSNNFVPMTGNFANTSKNWKAGRFYSTSPLTCQSIKFKVENKVNDKAFKLNDMSIEHRITSRKIV